MRKYIIPVKNNLEMRSWIEGDTSVLFNLVDENRDMLQEWLLWAPDTKSEADTEKFIIKCIEEYSNKKALQMGLWDGDNLVGSIGLNNIDLVSKKASIGYWLSKNNQSKGAMTKAVSSLIDYGFEILDLNRIELKIAYKNTKSRAVADRLGFKEEGVLRQDEFLNGEYIDYIIYSVLYSEWV
jgi:ribosomal-protein-serine acetyltransferase